MAFPTGYTKYQEVTIDSTKVSADLTDYVVYVDLADLSLAGADIFDTVRTDGGDIRVTKSDGTTELPREVVAIDTVAKTGELHIKYTGVLSSSTNTVIRIWYNGVDTEPLASSTYGSESVWTESSLWHFEHTSGNATDSTSSATTLTNTGVTYVSSKIEQGSQYGANTSDTLLNTSVGAGGLNMSAGNAKTFSFWIKQDASNDSFSRIYDMRKSGTGSGEFSINYDNVIKNINLYTNNGTVINYGIDLTIGSWYHFVLSTDASNNVTFYVNGASVATGTWGTATTSSNFTQIGNANGLTSGGHSGAFTLDESRMKQSSLSSSWVSTEYNNQNSPATFYSVSAESGGGLAPIALNTQATTIVSVSPSISGKANISPSTQVATIVGISPAQLTGTTVSPVTQTVSINVIPVVVVAGGNITLATATQVVSVAGISPTVSVVANKSISIGTQVVSVSAISLTVTAYENTILVMNAQTIVISTPTLAQSGAIWGKVAWGDSTNDWTKVSRTI